MSSAHVPTDFFSDLQARGLVKQHTDGLAQVLASGPVTLYCGFDPTAESLHVGSLMGLLTLRRFQLAGHRVLAVMGGATGMIGDPSGKSSERSLQDDAVLAKNLVGLETDIRRVLLPGYVLLNNVDWTRPVSMLEFLRDVGKHFTVNHMMAKESVRARLEDREHGISYTEFSYMLLQAYDFEVLYRTHACRLQVGGSDQWGNMTAGTDLIRRKHGEHRSHVMTWPLLMKADGNKFGKSESGTVWLHPAKTSPYDFYQFWFNTADADIENLLFLMSFAPVAEIHAVLEASRKAPENRLAQKFLARELTTLVHGAEEAEKIEAASAAAFSGVDARLWQVQTADELAASLGKLPSTEVTRAEITAGLGLLDLMVRAGLVDSKSQGRRDIQQNAIHFNDERVSDPLRQVRAEDVLAGGYLVLKRGKKTLKVARVTS